MTMQRARRSVCRLDGSPRRLMTMAMLWKLDAVLAGHVLALPGTLRQQPVHRVHSGITLPWTVPVPGGIPMEPELKHLEFIQGVVDCLASDSFRLKGWSVVLVAALFVVLAVQGRIELAAVGIAPVLLFWGLDGYFLWQERLFRALNDHVRGLEDGEVDFSMNTNAFGTGWERSWIGATLSFTLILFYGALLVTVAIAVSINHSLGQSHGV